jgi:Fe-S cluster assembly ATP-binding protein
MKNNILKIENLTVSSDKKKIINNLNLEVKQNEIHVIMGPNGSGKSTLSKVIAGHPSYNIEEGNINFLDKNLLVLSPEDRSHEGIFLAFQYPVEISGITNYDFLNLAYNQKQKFLGKSEVNPLEFLEIINKYLNELQIPNEFLKRDLNQGFSGGEKKKNEILQMLLLKPKLIILDELDSGLDIDALKNIYQNILDNLKNEVSLIIITHYPQILNYLKPTYVHIMMNGNIVKSGTKELIEILEREGYKETLSTNK